MAEFTETFTVAATPDAAFDYLADPMHRAEWDPSVRSIEPAGDGYRLTVGFYGRAIETDYRVAELDRPERIVFTADGKVRGRDEIEIAPDGDGARVSLRMTVELKGGARLLDRGLGVAFAGIGENAVAGIRSRLGG